MRKITETQIRALVTLARKASLDPRAAVGSWKSARVLEFIVFVDEVSDAIKAEAQGKLTPRAVKLLLLGQCCRAILNAVYRVHGRGVAAVAR